MGKMEEKKVDWKKGCSKEQKNVRLDRRHKFAKNNYWKEIDEIKQPERLTSISPHFGQFFYIGTP